MTSDALVYSISEMNQAQIPRSEAMLEAEELQEDEALQPLTLGSRGHPVLCRRACVWFAKGECSLGATCPYCHLHHEHVVVSLDKRQRRLLQDMDTRFAQDDSFCRFDRVTHGHYGDIKSHQACWGMQIGRPHLFTNHQTNIPKDVKG